MYIGLGTLLLIIILSSCWRSREVVGATARRTAAGIAFASRMPADRRLR